MIKRKFPCYNIYHNVSKHEWNLSVTWLHGVCHLTDRFSACRFANSPVKFITLLDSYVSHTFTLFTGLLSHVLCISVQVLLYLLRCYLHCHLPAFSFYNSTFSVRRSVVLYLLFVLKHTVTHSGLCGWLTG